jgi:hypothetical protein
VAPDLIYEIGVFFAGNELRIRTASPLVETVATYVFRHHLQLVASKACAVVDVALNEGGGFQLVVEGQLAAIALTDAELPVTLMQLGQRLLVFRETRQAMLHAAALVKNGRGFLFPATAGSGKTTLAAWLLGQGYGLLSDELVSVGEAGDLDGFTRPLNIKPGSRSLLDRFEWMDVPLAQSILSCGVTLVPWERYLVHKLSTSIVVCPSYVANAPFSIERLSHGRCAQELMGSLLNARNLPKHGLSFARRFAGTCPAYRIRYSHLEDVSSWLDQM